MFTDRRKKLALAAAILLVGIGAALYFRVDKPDELAGATHDRPGPTLPPISSANTDTKRGQEPTLAGHIEPYNAAQPPAHDRPDNWLDKRNAIDIAHAGLPADAASESAEAHLLQRSPLSTPSDAAPAAATSLASASAGSTLKWQTVPQPAANASLSFADSPTANDHAAAGIAVSARRHRIVDGDTLARLAYRYLGAEARHVELFEYNRDVLASPELLPIGQEVRIPPAGYLRPTFSPDESRAGPPPSQLTPVSTPATAAHPTASAQYNVAAPTFASPLAPSQTYVVRAHDTLPLIARKLYGDLSRQREILTANREQLRSASDLRAGMTLFVPARTNGRR